MYRPTSTSPSRILAALLAIAILAFESVVAIVWPDVLAELPWLGSVGAFLILTLILRGFAALPGSQPGARDTRQARARTTARPRRDVLTAAVGFVAIGAMSVVLLAAVQGAWSTLCLIVSLIGLPVLVHGLSLGVYRRSGGMNVGQRLFLIGITLFVVAPAFLLVVVVGLVITAGVPAIQPALDSLLAVVLGATWLVVTTMTAQLALLLDLSLAPRRASTSTDDAALPPLQALFASPLAPRAPPTDLQATA
jgi:hypothetical protein